MYTPNFFLKNVLLAKSDFFSEADTKRDTENSGHFRKLFTKQLSMLRLNEI